MLIRTNGRWKGHDRKEGHCLEQLCSAFDLDLSDFIRLVALGGLVLLLRRNSLDRIEMHGIWAKME